MTCAVAVALYNGERFLEKQLDSIRLQSYPPDQVVLCDDGSSDGTVDLVSRYIEQHDLSDRWTLHQNETNLGYIKNFYKAISLCQTDLIFLSDQDDIWKLDKLEKMSAVMDKHAHMDLLSCRYGIIDANDQELHSMVDPTAEEDEAVYPITPEDIMRAYRWPGMVMCLRRDFFLSLATPVAQCRAAHDLMFAVCAADRNRFYEYHYIGAYHRRHDNNTAKEEHRIRKLLNRNKKLSDLNTAIRTWNDLIEGALPIRPENLALIRHRLDLMIRRREALENRKLGMLLRLYGKNRNLLRMPSLLCDLWLICFAR